MPPMRGFNSDFNGKSRKDGSGVNAPLDAKGNTALHFAVEKNDRAALEKLSRVGANPNQPDKEGQTPLFTAITARNIDMVRVLVDKGASFEARDDKKRNALDWAIEKECPVEFIAQLRVMGADPASPAVESRRTAMHLAAEKNRPDLIEYLHTAGLSLNQQDSSGATPLHVAVAAKHAEALQKLIDLKADANIRNSQIETPLHLAAAQGNVAATDALLTLPEVRRGINDHRTYNKGWTPLMSAVAANQPAIIEKIVAVGGNVNQTDNENRNSLFIAVENGHLEAAKLLLTLGADCKKGPESAYNKSSMVHWINDKNYAEMLLLLYNGGFDLNAKDGSGQTALNKAAEQQSKDKIRHLLALGADPNLPNDYGRRPLDTIIEHYSFSYNDHAEIIGQLVSHGADVNLSPLPTVQQSPLHVAARNGNVNVMKLLVAHNANIDQPSRGPDAMTPFMMAAESGKHLAAQFLQEQGANVFKKDNWGRTALIFAARGGDEKTLESLLAIPGMDAKIDEQDSRGRSAMHHAFRKYHADFGVALIKKGARVDLHDFNGATPLHQAIETNYMADWLDDVKEALGSSANWNLTAKDGDTLLHAAARHTQAPVIEKLLDFGADVNIAGKNGQYPVHAAIMADSEPIAERLVKAMKDGNHSLDAAKDAAGWTPLHYAATRDNAGFTRMLAEAGADVNAAAQGGETPLHIAARTGKIGALQTLLAHGADMSIQNEKGQTPLDIAVEFRRTDFIQTLMMAAAQKAAAEAQAADAKTAAAANENNPAATDDSQNKKPKAPTP